MQTAQAHQAPPELTAACKEEQLCACTNEHNFSLSKPIALQSMALADKVQYTIKNNFYKLLKKKKKNTNRSQTSHTNTNGCTNVDVLIRKSSTKIPSQGTFRSRWAQIQSSSSEELLPHVLHCSNQDPASHRAISELRMGPKSQQFWVWICSSSHLLCDIKGKLSFLLEILSIVL